MATLTAESEVQYDKPWLSANATDEEDYFEEPLPDNWEEELANDPEVLAELDRRIAEMNAELATGTFVGSSTEEVFARLDKKFPQLRAFR